jgi:GWxTD domain-containing protein
MTNKQMAHNFIKYIASSEEIAELEKLNSDKEINSFLFKFWTKRDPKPSTKVNEFKEEHKKRFVYANNMLGGFQTDCGRVYILYGEPDEIMHKDMGKNSKSYEIWIYDKKSEYVQEANAFSNIESGKVKFVFVDLMGFGVKEQVFSTEKGEKCIPRFYNLDIYTEKPD